MVLPARIIAVLITVAMNLDLGQLFPEQLQITSEKSVKDGVLVQIEPGVVWGFDFKWVSHDGGLAIIRIFNLFAEMAHGVHLQKEFS